MDSSGNGAGWISGIATATTMLGILTFALFPFALPGLVLVVATAVLLALPLVVLGAVAAVLTGTWLGIRAAGRGIRRASAALTLRDAHHDPWRCLGGPTPPVSGRGRSP